MASWSLDGLHEAIARAVGVEPPPIGAGIRAFPRLGPGLFLNGYRILCFLRTNDLQEIRPLVPVDCLQEKVPSLSEPCKDTFALLSNPVLEHTHSLPDPGTRLLVYQETPGLRELAHSKQWELLANPFPIRVRWQNKHWFRNRLQEAGLPVARWIRVPLDELASRNYTAWRRKWGPRLVVQIPDFPRGGGRGTCFVNDEQELDALREKWRNGVYRKHTFKEVMVSPWIPGPSLSMEGCVTRWGVLHSPLQTQLLDLQEVLPPGRSGRFCGHQWGTPSYPVEVEASARSTIQWVGEALKTEGYLGVFGLDFVLDNRTGQLYALECNPRYTGAFPMLTLLQLAKDVPPLEAFHLMAWLDQTIPVPLDLIGQPADDVPPASQVLIFHREKRPATIRGNLTAGRYVWSHSQGLARRVGASLPLPNLPWDPFEFMILDGPPPEQTMISPADELEPILRIIFLKAVLEHNATLDPLAVRVIDWVYASLGIGASSA